MKADLQYLGEPAVYPGHEITLAFLIVKTYANLAEAESFTETGHYKAVSDPQIPGAGTSVFGAVRLLQLLRDGMPLDRVFAYADEHWIVDAAGPHEGKRAAGQAQADRIKKLFPEDVLPWLEV